MISELMQDFVPHGMCLKWNEWLILLHVFSDTVIALSYFAIPLVSFKLLKEKVHDPRLRRIWILFSLFIVFCGFTHILEMVNIWQPIYWETGFVKLLTAMVSAASFVEFYPFLKTLLDRPSIDEYYYIETKLNSLQQEKEKILSENKNLSDSIKNSDGMVIVISDNFIIQYANNIFLDLLGYKLEEIQDKSLHEISAGLVSIHDNLKLTECLKDGGRWNGEVVNFTKEGEIIHCIATITPILKKKEKRFDYVAIFYKINDFK